MNLSNLRNRLLLSMLLGVVVYAGVLAYGDFNKVADNVSDFRWELMPLILLVTCGNYALRWVKWEFYLNQIGVRGLGKVDSALVYFSGLGMTITPGKVGEWLKSYLLKEVHGTPVTRSAPILLAERLTDSLALLIIASAGVIYFGQGTWPIVVVVGVGSAIAVGVSRHRPTAHRLLALLGRVPFIGRFAPRFEDMYESTYLLMEPRGVLLMTGLSVGSWFFEVMAFYLTLVGLGVDGSLDTLLKAAFILPIATLTGAILLTPGGLGVTEAVNIKLSQNLLGMTAGAATVGTVIIRIATLWFGVVFGLVAFGILTRRLARAGKRLDLTPESAIAGSDPAG